MKEATSARESRSLAITTSFFAYNRIIAVNTVIVFIVAQLAYSDKSRFESVTVMLRKHSFHLAPKDPRKESDH